VSRTVGLFSLFLVGLIACGGGMRRAGQPSWREPEKIASAGASAPFAIEMAPAGPGASSYNPSPAVAPPRFPLADSIVREVERISGELGKPAPRPDGRLYAAARELAEVAPDDTRLIYSLIEFALQRNGIIEPSPHMVVVWAPIDDALIASLNERLPALLRANDFARLGVGVAKRAGGEEVTVLAFQSSFIQTSPIPRRVSQRGRIQIEATVDARYADPEVFVTREDGNVERMVLAAGARNGFRTELTCADHRGRQQVEITAIGDTGSTVLANFPVWCADDPPASIKVELDPNEANPVSPEEAAERLAQLVNRDREKHGLPALAIDPRLTEVARAHSREMRDTGVVGHVSPTSGSAADRVRAGNIKSSLVLENVARAYGVAEAEDGLMNSPGHRANILSRDATHMAMAVMLGGEVAGRRELFVTQLFIRLPAPIDRRQVRDDVTQVIKKRRRQLDEDRELSLIAQELAESVASGATPTDASQGAGKRLAVMRLPYSKVTTQISTVADVTSFVPDSSLDDRSLAAFGLGVAQGDHDVIGESAIHIVLLFGHQ
jgi:uncharacterized protein YkwD